MGKYELSIAEDYVQDWGIEESVREFFQNAIDQEAVDTTNKMYFNYDKESETLSIGNLNSVLDVSTLLLGSSTKRDDNNTIGQFGEGYKIATLVALRTGHNVVFYNYGKREVWKPRLVNSRRYGAKVLTFFTEHHVWGKIPDANLTVEISNVTKNEYNSIKDRILPLKDAVTKYDCSKGSVLTDECEKGNIYLNGLFVSHNTRLTHGYDLPATAFKLDRDRRMIDNFDLIWYLGSVWTEQLSNDKDGVIKNLFIDLLNSEAEDIKHLHHTSGNIYDMRETGICDTVYDNFVDEYGDNAVPIKNNAGLESFRLSGSAGKPIIVSENKYSMIELSDKYRSKLFVKLLSRDELLLQWFESVKSSLTDEEQEDFMNIYNL
jgi:hypothetical protein